MGAFGTISCIQQENLQATHTLCKETVERREEKLIIPIMRIHIFLSFVSSYRSMFEQRGSAINSAQIKV